MAGFYSWSEQNLGQWHYVLGYTITLLNHNWPIALAFSLCVWFGYKAYRWPSRLWVTWLLTALLFGLAYEYQKHVAGELHLAIDFLFGLEIAALNRSMHLLVGPVMQTVLALGCLALLAQSARHTVAALRPGPHSSAGVAGEPDPSRTPAPQAREGDTADERSRA